MQFSNAVFTNAPPSRHRCWLLNCAAMISGMVPLLFNVEDAASMISKKNFQIWLIRPEDNVNFTSVSFNWACVQTRWCSFWIFLTFYFIYLFFFFVVEFCFAFVDAVMNFVGSMEQWFPVVFLSPCSDLPLKVQRPRLFSMIFLTSILVCRDFVRFFKSVKVIMYHRWSQNSLQFYFEKCLDHVCVETFGAVSFSSCFNETDNSGPFWGHSCEVWNYHTDREDLQWLY